MNKTFIFVLVALVFVGSIVFRLATHNTNSTNTKQMMKLDNLRHATLKIDGMDCVSCAYNIENALKDTPGIVNVSVGFVGEKVVSGTGEGRGYLRFYKNNLG